MMGPKRSQKYQRDIDDNIDTQRIALLTGSLVVTFLLAPIIYRLTMNLIKQDHEHFVNSNLLAFIVTSTFCAGLLLLSNTYIKYFSDYLTKDSKQLKGFSRPTFLIKLFAVFTNVGQHQGTSPSRTNGSRNLHFYSGDSLDANQQGDHSGKRKIDSKYFKPKFIIHELMTFWGTTCTVITWGSFYIIGGTVVMSERLVQKVKAKSKSPRENSSFTFLNNNHNTSNSSATSAKGTGQSDFSFSSAFGGCNTSSAQASSNNNTAPSSDCPTSQRKPPFQRISSWTRRSVITIRKKFSRPMRSNAPQLTTAPANDSFRR